MVYKESDIAYEAGAFWVLRRAPGYFEVLQTGATHSVVVGTFDFKSDPARHDYALNRAIEDCNRRAHGMPLAADPARPWSPA
jgi:hypothetical protein